MTQIVCHRGACRLAPENTFASAEAALALGGDVIELDIRQSSDGVLYVLHDGDLDRTTNGSGPIRDMHSAQVDKLDAGGWFDQRFSGEPVPRLDAFLAHFQSRAGFYLEMKQADCEAVADLVKRLGIIDQCFTCSFDPEMREGMRRYLPSMRHMVHWNDCNAPGDAVETHMAQIVEFDPDNFNQADIRACQAAGLGVGYFSDRNDRGRFRQALDLSLSFVNIDFISEFAELKNERAA